MSLDWILKFNEYLISDESVFIEHILSLNNLLNSINKTDIFFLTEQNKRLIKKKNPFVNKMQRWIFLTFACLCVCVVSDSRYFMSLFYQSMS